METFARIARREQQRHPLWLTVTLVDRRGQRLVNTLTEGRLGPALDQPSFHQVIEQRRPVIGAIVEGASGYGIPIRAPVLRDGKVTGVIGVAIRPQGLSAAIQATHLPANWVVSLVDSSGRVVARNRNTERYIGGMASPRALAARKSAASGIYQGLTLEGVQTVSAFWTSPSSGWSVHIGIPEESYGAPLRRQTAFTVAGLVLSVCLTGLFVALLLRELRLRRREAAALEQSNRMEALGRLTGGVAHDFNNLLMIIQGNTEVLQRRMTGEDANRPLAAIREATDRAAKLTRELLVFARGGQAETTVVDLNATLSDFVGSVKQAVGPGVEVEVELDPQAGAVDVDRVQLELAVLNLAVNARDAMNGEGRLTLSTRHASDAFVQVSIADTGPGIPDEIRHRVFDPFFTTKPPGVGTGLGLTQVYGFVRHSGGFVELQSRPGRGATVIMRLPIARRAPASEPAPRPEARGRPDLAGRRILVLDDNAEVRRVTADYLGEEGAEVVAMGSAREGLAALSAGTFDAVISDIVMPGDEDGLALAETVRERWPEIPVLLLSGYSASLVEAGARGFRVLRKPFPLPDLGVLLRELVGSAPSDHTDVSA